MSNKLTNEKLKELILEVMSESTSTSQPPQPNQNIRQDYQEPIGNKEAADSINKLFTTPLNLGNINLQTFNQSWETISKIYDTIKTGTDHDKKIAAMLKLDTFSTENNLQSPHFIVDRIEKSKIFLNSPVQEEKVDEKLAEDSKTQDLINAGIFEKGKEEFPTKVAKKFDLSINEKRKDEDWKKIIDKLDEYLKLKDKDSKHSSYHLQKNRTRSYKKAKLQVDLDKKKEKIKSVVIPQDEVLLKKYQTEYNNFKSILTKKLEPIDLKQASGAFDLKKHSQSTGDVEGFDIYGTKNVFKTNFEKLGLQLNDEIFNKLQKVLSNAFDAKDFKAISALKEVTTKQFNIDDLASLFTGIDKPSDEVTIPNTTLKVDAVKIKSSLKKAYQAIMNDDNFQGKTKQAALNSIRDLRDSVDYFASKRKLRTKTGAQTGFNLGTAETSGRARTSKALASTFSNVSSGKDVQSRFRDLEKFLNETNQLVINNSGALSGNLQERFSRFVALEILNKQIFRTQEAGGAGFLFESFLAMFLGGAQTGGDRGASDFTLPNGDAGSAKLVADFKFQQSAKGLQADTDMLYVVALKSTQTKSGLKRLSSGEKERIQVIDIHLYKTSTTQDPSGAWEYKASPINDASISIVGEKSKTQRVFKLSSGDLKASFIARLDFSFMFEREFEDVSSQIMKGVAEEVEQAFSALTNLKNNITSWISEKDLIAANQVTQDQRQLNDAVDKMRKDTNTFAVSENKKKSLKDLDKLIEQVILYNMLIK